MPLTRLLPWLLTAIASSVASAVAGVHAGRPWLVAAAALLFALVLVASSFEINRQWLYPEGRPADDAPIMSTLRNARLLVIAYVWGSLTMFAIYRLSGLYWQHGLQYAVGMMLVATLIMTYVHLLARDGSPLRAPQSLRLAAGLAALHGGAAIVGLGFLLGSGKMLSRKTDWAANHVFLAGGLAIIGLSALAVLTYFRLEQSFRMQQTGAQPRQNATAEPTV